MYEFIFYQQVMKILTEQITVDQLMNIESERFFDYMVKAVVDVHSKSLLSMRSCMLIWKLF